MKTQALQITLNSHRNTEPLVERIAWLSLLPPIAYVVLPGLLGCMLIGLIDLVSRLLNIGTTSWTVSVFVVVFYFLGLLSLFALGAAFEVVVEFLKAVNHAMQRTLAIFIVGISDLFFHGHSLFASLLYILLVAFQALCGYVLTTSLYELSAVQAVVAAISSNTLVFKVAPLDTFVAGLALAYSLVFLMIPIMALGLPTWRNVTIRPKLVPINELALPTWSDTCKTVKIAHISDLHVRETDDQSKSPNVSALSGADRNGAEIIALTGDITDNGSVAAWEKFCHLPLISSGDSRIVLVPGNHDLNTWNDGFWRSLFQLDSYRRVEAHRRAYLYLQVVNQVMGHRSWVVCPYTGAVRRLNEVFNHALPSLQAWDRNDSVGQGLKPDELLQKIFPMLVETRETESGAKVLCIVWNTVKANRWALLNAVGELGPDQVTRAEQLLAERDFATNSLLHLMHHQIAVPRNNPISRRPSPDKLSKWHSIGMGLQTAEHFLSLIRKRAQSSCVLHGHHHKFFVCKEAKSGLAVISSPSSKFGTEVSYSINASALEDWKWLLIDIAVSGVHLELGRVQTMK